MDFMKAIQPGMVAESSFKVARRFTATHIGSGSMAVLATPSMIGFIERVARDLLAEHLPKGHSSVGVHVDVHHLAPTPLGRTVRVRCQVISVEGSRVNFAAQVWDEVEKVGEGEHQRVVIDEVRFLKRVKSKKVG